MAVFKKGKTGMGKLKAAAVRASVQIMSCEVFSTAGITCPLCQTQVPPNVRHECEVNGGVKTVRNRPNA